MTNPARIFEETLGIFLQMARPDAKQNITVQYHRWRANRI